MKGEVDASMVWSTAFAVAQQATTPRRSSRWCRDTCRRGDQRWNLNFVVRKEDKTLLEFINDGIGELLDNGKIKEIVESYGVPFYPPFSS